MPYTLEMQVKFFVVRVESPYNAILDRLAMAQFQVVGSIPHLELKFPTEKEIGEMRGDEKNARIIVLDDLVKDQEYTETENGKEKG